MKRIAEQFDIEGKILYVERLGDGFINDTFIVGAHTDKGTRRYILQRKNGNIFKNIYWPYNKDTYNFVAKNNREKLLLEIMQNAFYAHELNLYLDIYPNDANRIKLYNEYNKKTNDLISKYNNTYEPLTLSGNELNEVPWSWEDSPWPWEGV